MKENKGKGKFLLIFAVLGLIVAISSVSYALFTFARLGETNTTITSGDIEFSYLEGESVTLEDAFPVADNIGANDTKNIYEFTVKMNSSSEKASAIYNVSLLTDNSGTDNFNNNDIKYNLEKNGYYVSGSADSGELLSSINGFDENSSFGLGVVLSNQELSSGDTDQYKLRIWIDENVNYSGDIDSDGTMTGTKNNYTYSLKVKVDSTADVTGVEVNPIVDSYNIDGATATIELKDQQGIRAYAFSATTDTPTSDEWTYVNDDGTIKQMATGTNKKVEVSYTANEAGTYYVHMMDTSYRTSYASFEIGPDAFWIYGLAGNEYQVGDIVSWAGLDWYILKDNGDNSTLILKDTIENGSYGSNSTWASSTAYSKVNTTFLNNNSKIKSAIDEGSLKYDESSSSYLRIPYVDELSSKIPTTNNTSFWTMSSVNSTAVYVGAPSGVKSDNYSPSYTRYYSGLSHFSNTSLAAITLDLITSTSMSDAISTTASTINNSVTSSSIYAATSYYTGTTTGYDAQWITGKSWCASTGVSSGNIQAIRNVTYYAASNSGCSSRTYYNLSTTNIGYRPVVTVSEVNWKLSLSSKDYVMGDTVRYAGSDWLVLSDNGDNTTLVLKDTYKIGSFGANSTWETSNAKNELNTTFINTNGAINAAVESGTILLDSTLNNYVRIPYSTELSNLIPTGNGNAFWTMTPNETTTLFVGKADGTLSKNYIQQFSTFYRGMSDNSWATLGAITVQLPVGITENDYVESTATKIYKSYNTSTSYAATNYYTGTTTGYDAQWITGQSWCTSSGTASANIQAIRNITYYAASTSTCSLRTSYNLESLDIGYRPVITVVEK